MSYRGFWWYSSYSMPTGIDGVVRKETKKIYPNDPCPCGSEKNTRDAVGRNNR